MKIVPGEINTGLLHQYLLGSVAPRPICFASTIDSNGRSNLSPFSFFNVFGVNPAILIFSPSRRLRDNTTKDTLQNIYETMEVVVNVVSHNMVQQANISSCDYPSETDEFIKAGFNKMASEKVKPFRVAESPVQMECRVQQVIETGVNAGAGNLVICEILLIHINDIILDEQLRIDPDKIDLVARMGFDSYCRASGAALFEVAKPNARLAIGIDQLPASIRKSSILTGNQLGILANVDTIPVVNAGFHDERLTQIIQYFSIDPDDMETELHRYAGQLLHTGNLYEAWQVLLALL